MIEIGRLRPEDRANWEVLARGYQAFYQRVLPDEDYDRTWDRLRAEEGVHGLAARSGGRVVGIAHYLFHTTVWLGEGCYLQDLFVAEEVRGQGVARALIERVASVARDQGASRLYWTTQQDNTRARILYDKVASFNGFIRYDRPLA